MSIYAVNGKTPIAAWIPSLDTAGNGTTTLTDLVGSNNGTLTNMDPATDWVADTGAGGVRALDFDGVDDRVNLGSPFASFANFSVACWVYPSGTNESRYLLGQRGTESLGWWTVIKRTTGWRFEVKRGDGTAEIFSPIATYTQDSWQHIGGTFDGSTVRVFLNGVQVGTGTAFSGLAPAPTVSAAICSIRGDSAFGNFLGRVDDVRFFSQALVASDFSYLYNSGNGRGITAATGTIQTRRRRDLGGYGL